MMFVRSTNEKAAVAARVGRELKHINPGPSALRVFDAGMGDGSVLSELLREMHQTFTHIPWLVAGKEISIEDVRGATLVAGVWQPSPLLFVVVMIVIQSWVWTFAVSRWLTTEEGAQQVV